MRRHRLGASPGSLARETRPATAQAGSLRHQSFSRLSGAGYGFFRESEESELIENA